MENCDYSFNYDVVKLPPKNVFNTSTIDGKINVNYSKRKAMYKRFNAMFFEIFDGHEVHVKRVDENNVEVVTSLVNFEDVDFCRTAGASELERYAAESLIEFLDYIIDRGVHIDVLDEMLKRWNELFKSGSTILLKGETIYRCLKLFGEKKVNNPKLLFGYCLFVHLNSNMNYIVFPEVNVDLSIDNTIHSYGEFLDTESFDSAESVRVLLPSVDFSNPIHRETELAFRSCKIGIFGNISSFSDYCGVIKFASAVASAYLFHESFPDSGFCDVGHNVSVKSLEGAIAHINESARIGDMCFFDYASRMVHEFVLKSVPDMSLSHIVTFMGRFDLFTSDADSCFVKDFLSRLCDDALPVVPTYTAVSLFNDCKSLFAERLSNGGGASYDAVLSSLSLLGVVVSDVQRLVYRDLIFSEVADVSVDRLWNLFTLMSEDNSVKWCDGRGFGLFVLELLYEKFGDGIFIVGLLEAVVSNEPFSYSEWRKFIDELQPDDVGLPHAWLVETFNRS